LSETARGSARQAAHIGILLLDKPLGLSSNAALQRVRYLFGRVKAGHTGSLDPLASGMLPICLGEATKLAGELLAGRKTYRFTLQLGARTDTGDAEGAVIERSAVPVLTPALVETVLAGHRGDCVQVPPMYSALKRAGEPLYRLARRGVTVERTARPIRIDELQLLRIDGAQLQLRALCSGGTYIRVLGEDLARALGSGGHLAALRREHVEPFGTQPMWSLEQLENLAQRGAAGLNESLLAADQAVAHLRPLILPDAEADALAQGKVLTRYAPGADTLWRLYDRTPYFLGLGASDGDGNLRVRRLFSAPLPITAPAAWPVAAPRL